MSERHVGIDLGASQIWAVAVFSDGDQPAVDEGLVCSPDRLDELVAFCGGTTRIAIDAPSSLSRGLHADDSALPPKFRTARCSEIALREQHRFSVPWTTPTTLDACQEWMRVGFDTWSSLREACLEPLETYPYAGFTMLAGRRLKKKTTPEGLAERRQVLQRHLRLPSTASFWTHDAIDAALAALVAADADEVSCARHDHTGHDESSIWLPHVA